MTPDLEEWLNNTRARRRASIPFPVRVVGEYDKHLGPRWAYARIEISAQPWDRWEVAVSLSEDDRVEMEKDGWLNEAILGVLDVLITEPTLPAVNTRLDILAVKHDPMDSSRHAFRMAGRDAGHKILSDAQAPER